MTTKAQQSALDNSLVAPENQHVIGKCNMRINLGMKPKEPTYQVVLYALALTSCYHAFLITAEVLVIYMHQFWATVNKHKISYRFKIDNKRFSVNVEVFRDILNICPRVPSQEFDEPPTEEEALSFIRELGHSGEIKYIIDVIVDHPHQPWRTFASIINKCLCGKEDLAYQIDNKDSKKQDKMFYPRFTKIMIHHFLKKDKSISMRNRTFMHTVRDENLLGTMRFVSRHEDTQVYGSILPKAMTNQAMLDSVGYKTYYAITSGAEPPKSKKPKMKSDLAISSEETPFKKKHAKAKKDVPLTKKPATKPKPTKKKASQLSSKRVPDEQQSKISGTDEGTGTKQEVPDVPKYDSESDKESWGDSGEEDDDDDSDQERTESDKDDEENEEESDDGEELYKDVNVNLRKEDVEMTNVDQGGADQHNVSQESGFEQEEEDAHVTLTTVHDTQKTKGLMQSSSISSDFTKKLLNFDNVSSADNEIASLMDTTVRTEEPSGQTSTLFNIPITVIPTTIPPPPYFFNPLPQQTTPTPKPTTSEVTTAFPALPDFASVFRFNDRVTNLERDLSEIKQVDQEEAQADKQEYIDLIDLSVRTIIKEELKTQLPHILPKAVSDFATPSTYEAAASLSEYELMKILLDKIEESKSHLRADYKRKFYDALVESYNTDKYLFNTYGKVFTLKRSRDNKDKDQDPFAGSDRGTKRRKSSKEAKSLKDQRSKEGKSSSSSKELLVGPALNLLKGTCKSLIELEYHFEECSKATTERLDWHNPEGKPYPFDLRKPLSLILDRQGRQVIPKDYFVNNDLEYLKGGSLSRQYSTSVTKTKAATYEIKWIEDMVSNLWSPVKVNLRNRTAYTAYSDPQGVIYKDQNNKNILMRTDELHKFSDGTLNDVRTALQDALGIRMEYLPKKKWSGLDKQRARVMIQDIDKQLFQRRLMRNLKKFVGGREYENDLRLLERTT
ncbi:hypothetical protein Tco_0039956 [Tanacetum coccineum]